MILISHRGNIIGPNPRMENQKSYILSALNRGYDVEVDVWYEKSWWLGHDKPEYKVSFNWLSDTPNLWVHCKNLAAMYQMNLKDDGFTAPHYFWHQNDDVALTSHKVLWTFLRKPLTKVSVCVLPELGNYTHKELKSCFGICSNQIVNYKNL